MTSDEWEMARSAAYVFASWTVERWANEHEGRAPTLEELQDEPFNFTAEFAQGFMERASARGWIVPAESDS